MRIQSPFDQAAQPAVVRAAEPLAGATVTWNGDDSARLLLGNGRRFALDRPTAQACECLLAHPAATPDEVAATLAKRHGLETSPERLRQLRELLRRAATAAPVSTAGRGITLLTLESGQLPLVRGTTAAVVGAAAVGLACLAAALVLDRLTVALPATWQPWIVFAAALIVNRVGHELGHCVAGLWLGAPRVSVRLRRRGLLPLLSSRIDGLDELPRRVRVAITGAGFLGQGLVAISLFPLLLVPVAFVRQGVLFAAVEVLAFSVPVNLSPLSSTDGYYLLVDALREPRLRSLTAERLRGLLKGLTPGQRAAPPGGGSAAVLVFGLVVAVYLALLAILYGIMLTSWLGPVGVVLTGVALVLMVWGFATPRERVWRL